MQEERGGGPKNNTENTALPAKASPEGATLLDRNGSVGKKEAR